MAKLNARSIALEGIGFGHRAIAILGFKWFSVEVIPPVVSVGGGGFVEHVTSPAKLVISIKVNGVWKRNVYEISDFFYKALVFSIKHIPTKFKFSEIRSTLSKIMSSVKLNSIHSVKPEIHVKEKDVSFKIRRKK